MTVSEEWSEEQVTQNEADFGAYLLRLDDHLFEAQAAYVNLISKLKKVGPPIKNKSKLAIAN
jgi:hypothetical protein